MGFIKCFDAVTRVTDEATKRFSPILQEDDDKKYELCQSCKLLDSIAAQFGGVAYKTEVSRDTAEISVTLTCSEFETTIESSAFCALLDRTRRVKFRVSGDDQIKIEFTFDSIWSPSYGAQIFSDF